ncbi:MAG: class I SAM-dependent methyltransferase [bacterium]|nr:class I SAM-dependent methyltransferase [bacterium]
MNSERTATILAGVENQVKQEKIGDELEYFSFHKNRYFDLLNRLEKLYHNNFKLLDVGSRCGHILMGARALGYDCYGCDILKYSELYNNRFKRFGIKNSACLFPDDKIPYEDNFFDLAILSETIEHYNFHPAVVFKEISRVLKKGGLLLITTPNLARLNNRIKILLGKSINYDIWLPYNDGIHYREYNDEELAYLLKSGGLETEEIKFIYFDYKDSNLLVRAANLLSGLVFKKMRSNIVIIARKK